MTVRRELWASRGKSFVGVGVLKGRLPRTKTLILIGINFVPAASLAPDKGTWYSLKKSRHLQEATKTFLRSIFFPLSAFVYKSPCRTDKPCSSSHPFSILLPHFHIWDLFRGTQPYSLPLPPLVWKEAQLQRQLFVGQKSALVKAKANSIFLAEKQPTTTHFTFVVTCLFRHQL